MFEDFTIRLQELDDDSLIQRQHAVDECLGFLEGRPSNLDVMGEALLVSSDIQREFLRRAMDGRGVRRKATA